VTTGQLNNQSQWRAEGEARDLYPPPSMKPRPWTTTKPPWPSFQKSWTVGVHGASFARVYTQAYTARRDPSPQGRVASPRLCASLESTGKRRWNIWLWNSATDSR